METTSVVIATPSIGWQNFGDCIWSYKGNLTAWKMRALDDGSDGVDDAAEYA